MNRYYAIKYAPDGKGCPYLLSGDFTPDDWEFENVEPLPLEIEVMQKYSLKISTSEIKFLDFDYYDNEPRLVSNRFLEVCDELKVLFKAIPLWITLKKGVDIGDEYNFFHAGKNLGLLDLQQSVYTVERMVENGEVMANHAFPSYPIYSRIEKFVTKEDEFPALFFCIEIMRLVCDEAFYQRATEAGLKGLEFVAIDEAYVYDFWDDS
jgi:hypothetical protein